MTLQSLTEYAIGAAIGWAVANVIKGVASLFDHRSQEQ